LRSERDDETSGIGDGVRIAHLADEPVLGIEKGAADADLIGTRALCPKGRPCSGLGDDDRGGGDLLGETQNRFRWTGGKSGRRDPLHFEVQIRILPDRQVAISWNGADRHDGKPADVGKDGRRQGEAGCSGASDQRQSEKRSAQQGPNSGRTAGAERGHRSSSWDVDAFEAVVLISIRRAVPDPFTRTTEDAVLYFSSEAEGYG
jgi:hypothetical protein